jgi:hypothetical protein
MMPLDQRQDQPDNPQAASVIDEPVPADLLTIRAPAPDWFRWAISNRGQTHFEMVAGCRIHYLLWARDPASNIDNRPLTRIAQGVSGAPLAGPSPLPCHWRSTAGPAARPASAIASFMRISDIHSGLRHNLNVLVI